MTNEKARMEKRFRVPLHLIYDEKKYFIIYSIYNISRHTQKTRKVFHGKQSVSLVMLAEQTE